MTPHFFYNPAQPFWHRSFVASAINQKHLEENMKNLRKLLLATTGVAIFFGVFVMTSNAQYRRHRGPGVSITYGQPYYRANRSYGYGQRRNYGHRQPRYSNYGGNSRWENRRSRYNDYRNRDRYYDNGYGRSNESCRTGGRNSRYDNREYRNW